MLTGFCSVLFGGMNTIVGHPMDTVKTKMQAQTEMLSGHSGVMGTIKRIY